MQNLSYENEFHLHVNENSFMKGYAPRLALKKRYKRTQKWPIEFLLFLSCTKKGIWFCCPHQISSSCTKKIRLT